MDPIANMLTQIRNACMRGMKEVSVPKSKLVKGILEVLSREEFIENFEQDDHNYIVRLKYRENGKSQINELHKVSKGGLRKYVGWRDLSPVLRGRGIGIISTSSGILSVEEAIEQKVGGEYICKIW